jgi:type II secretory pathway pseudopilin PulG
MQEKQGAGYFLEIVVVVALLGILSAVALPNVGHLVNKGKTESYDTELHNIQTAVIEMLLESPSGKLEPVGPTDDMSRVQTSDNPPNVLCDYLHFLGGTLIRSGCTYIFSEDGTVIQFTPS